VARPLTAWTRGVNAHLPASAAVLWAQEVPAEFHARFAATARHYTYLLVDRAQRPGLNAGRVGWYHLPLDLDAMRAGAAQFVGTHDFSSFRAAECQAKSPVKTVLRADVSRAGDLLRFDFSANAFLHHMIRNIVGALVYVGAGRESPASMRALLDARDRTRAPPTFAADGLYFAGADYDARFALPPTVRSVQVSA
jgi:tRNA pseudouridine38-40 synthase